MLEKLTKATFENAVKEGVCLVAIGALGVQIVVKLSQLSECLCKNMAHKLSFCYYGR